MLFWTLLTLNVWTNTTETFFKNSSFVFHKGKSVIQNSRVSNNDRNFIFW